MILWTILSRSNICEMRILAYMSVLDKIELAQTEEHLDLMSLGQLMFLLLLEEVSLQG